MAQVYSQDEMVTIYCGDCIEVMAEMPENSMDAIVTDPPYGLEFMGKEWDKLSEHISPSPNLTYPKSRNIAGVRYDESKGLPMQLWHQQWATQALRVLKPGGYLLAFGGTRTNHRLVCGLEDAGFEIKDTVLWLYGSGFPKSEDVSKAIDKQACREQLERELGRKPTREELKQAWTEFREIVGKRVDISSGRSMSVEQAKAGAGKGIQEGWDRPWRHDDIHAEKMTLLTAPATEAAKEWQGWGTALKPAFEPIVVAHKPLSEKNVASNVLKWGTGGLYIDGARIGTSDNCGRPPAKLKKGAIGYLRDDGPMMGGLGHTQGRWPANVILDEEAATLLDEQSGESRSVGGTGLTTQSIGGRGAYHGGDNRGFFNYGDSGGASRFFYVAKASKAERGKGNVHPTCKPVTLMEYLVKLVSRPGATILDPFAGSMSTVLAAVALGRKCIAIEQSEEYCEMLRDRSKQIELNISSLL